MLLRAYAALLLGLLRALLGCDRARRRRQRRRVVGRHAVADRLRAQETAQVGGPPGERLAVGRVPVVVVVEVEELALEAAVPAVRARVQAHRVLEGVRAVAGRIAVRRRARLHGAQRVPDLVADGVLVAEAVAVAEDQR